MNADETDRIESWKGVADYLKCDVTTAMRWARERGLPVHRHPGDKRSRVYAFRGELDAWLATGPRTEVAAREAEIASHQSQDSQPSSEGSAVPALDRTVSSARPAVGPWWDRRKWLAAGVAIVALSALTGSAYNRMNGSAQPTAVRFEGETLVAVDARDRTLWTHAFGQAPGEIPHLVFDDRHWVGDLDDDGFADVLVVFTRTRSGRAVEDTLHCFDHRGKQKWSFTLNDTIRFRTGEFGPPWFAGGLAVYDVDGAKRIALTQAHNTWWPGVLVTLNARGERLSTFVSSGVIYQLRAMTSPAGKPWILAGGVSNSRAAASLMALDGSDPTGATPEEPGSPYECLGCPMGTPLRYFLFPTSELALVAGRPYNNVTGLHVTGGIVEARVLEVGATTPGLANAAITIFQFRPDLRFMGVRWSDSFQTVHDWYERHGSLKHRAESCPNREPIVRELVPGRGLVTLVAGSDAGSHAAASRRSGAASR